MRVKKIIGKIAKICAYIPVLWNDEDWDYSYLLDLIKFKLNRMKNTIYKNNFIARYEIRDICIGINQTIDHINNYQNDSKAYKDINGDLPFKVGFKHKQLENGCYNLITWNEDEDRQLNKQEEEIYDKYIKDCYDFEQKEWEAIFDTIKKEGQKWWD
jgi:hypothetical protein